MDRIKPTRPAASNLKRDFLESSLWAPVEDTKDGLIVVTTDPERVRASRIVSNIFPKHRVIYRVTTARELVSTLDQFFGGELTDTWQHRRPALGYDR